MPEITDRRAMLREAASRLSEEEPETTIEETPEEPAAEPAEAAAEEAPGDGHEETADEKAARERDEKGRFASAPKAEKEPKAAKAALAPKAKPGAPVDPKAAAAPVVAQPAAPVAPKGPETKPPQSWTPAEREVWGKLTPEAQRAVLRTEGETRRVLSENAGLRKEFGEAQKFRGEVESFVRPFEGIFRAQGMEPMQGVASVVQTYAALHYGAPQQKAAILADLIQRFSSVDDINAAAEALAQGRGPAPAQPQHSQAPQRQQPMDVRAAIREELAGFTQQAVSARADRDLDTFLATGPEFIDPDRVGKALADEVWDNMQTVFDAAAKRGRNPTYEQVYNQALKMSDEAASISQQRAQAAAAAQPSATAPTVRARAAAATVRSRPAAAVAPAADPNDRRAMLQKAMESTR